jgi:hypothetical protein
MKSNPAPATDSGDAGGTVPSSRRRRGANGPRLLPAPAAPVDPVLALIERVARDPTADLDKLQRLLEMRAKAEADANERAFNEALAAAQSEMEPVRADAVNAEVGRAHRYASYAQLDRAIRPIYTAHGLAVTFTAGERSTDTAVEVVAYITGHGHGRRYSIVMPADGKGPRGGDVMSRTHATASAISYGMRYLLVMAFNLAVDRDDDGNAAGRVSTGTGGGSGAVTPDQLRHINRLATDVKANLRRFCKFMQVPTLADIPAERYQHAIAALEAKRQATLRAKREAQQGAAR